MNLKNIKKAIVQIKTPIGRGTGFCLKNKNIIVTNNNLINGVREVVISGINIEKQITNVLFSDSVYNLAFLQLPANISLPKISLSKRNNIKEGEGVTAMGYSDNFTTTFGKISEINRKWNKINYFKIDSAINIDNSGGPLIDSNNKVIAINTYIQTKTNDFRLALPVSYLNSAIKEYKKNFGKFTIKCHSCFSLLTTEFIEKEYCPNCGANISQDDYKKKDFTISSAGKKIEEIIKKLEYNVRLSRIGNHLWEIKENSVTINIKFNPKTKYLVAYSKLFKFKKENIQQTYEYLLQENNKLKELTFSIKKHQIILSSMFIYEDNIHIDTGVKLLKNLINKTIYYYNNI